MKSAVNLRKLVQIAILVAIILLMSFTPLGYFKIGLLEISFLSLPVAVGAMLLGPAAGAFLGGVFGLTSFLQCFGANPFGAMLLGINPVFTAILCLVPRILMGLLCGLIFNAVFKRDKTKVLSFAAGSVSAALLNTVLFLGSLYLLFFVFSTSGSSQIEALVGPILPFIYGAIFTNGLVEAGVCLVIGTAVTKTLYFIFRERKA